MSYFNTYVITGVTGTGKTRYAINLAKKFIQHKKNLLIISIDSRKAYKYLNIGTHKYAFLNNIAQLKKLTKENDTKIIACGINLFLPTQNINVFKFYNKLKQQCLKKQINKFTKFYTIVFGGTLLYLRPILNLPVWDNPQSIPYLRYILNSLEINKIKFLASVIMSDFKNLNYSEQNNKVRLIRKIEINILKNTEKFKILIKELVQARVKFNLTRLKKQYNLIKKKSLKDQKTILEIQKFIQMIINTPIKLELFTINKEQKQAYLKKLLSRIVQMFKLNFAQEVAHLMLKYYKNNDIHKIPAFNVMGYDILFNYLHNNYKLILRNAKFLDNTISKLDNKYINNQKFTEYLANYYLNNNYYGIEKIIDIISKNFNIDKKAFSIFMRIFKRHLNYAKYQNQSIYNILKIKNNKK